MKIAALQMDMAWEDRQANFDKVSKFALQAQDKGAELLILPEMFSTGFSMNPSVTAEETHGPGASFIRSLAVDHKMAVLGGVVFKGKKGLGRNCALVVDSSGKELACYSKTHLFSFLKEDEHHEPGNAPQPFNLGGLNICCFICYDLRFPELFRLEVDQVYLSIVIASWPASRQRHWDLLLPARAVENQQYVIGVNRVGVGGGLDFTGGTAVYDPLGTQVAHGGHRETLLVADIHPAKVLEVRNTMPFLKDRRF